MIVPINTKERALVEPVPSPLAAGSDDTGTGVWIGRIEAAARLGVRERTLDRLASDGMIERVYRRIPGCRPEPLFYLEQIERLLAARPAVFSTITQQPIMAQQAVPIPSHTGMNAPAVSTAATELAEVLSPSQVRCFMDCQVRWWFKYGLKYPDPPTGNLALGKAVHSPLTQNFAQKMDTYEDLPVAGVRALFREAWAIESEQTEFRDDENPSALAACGEALVAKYMDEVAPTIEPAAVEVRVEGEIAGIKVQGWIDLLDVDGRIIDIKTAARKPSGIDPDYRFQIATYAQLTRGASGEARVDTLVKTKTPSLVTQSFTVSDRDRLATHKLYSQAQQSMRSELYMPNRLSLACSRRNCAYWRSCECEWGGEVPET